MLEPLVVADSSPLIALARIHRLALLPRLCSSVLVPPAVWAEVTEARHQAAGAMEVTRADWIEVREPDRLLAMALGVILDKGEAEAIALACATPGCLLFMDEKRGRRVAADLDVPQIGTVGLLLRARRSGLLDRLRPELEALAASGFHIGRLLLEAALREAGEADEEASNR